MIRKQGLWLTCAALLLAQVGCGGAVPAGTSGQPSDVSGGCLSLQADPSAIAAGAMSGTMTRCLRSIDYDWRVDVRRATVYLSGSRSRSELDENGAELGPTPTEQYAMSKRNDGIGLIMIYRDHDIQPEIFERGSTDKTASPVTISLSYSVEDRSTGAIESIEWSCADLTVTITSVDGSPPAIGTLIDQSGNTIHGTLHGTCVAARTVSQHERPGAGIVTVDGPF